MTEGVFVILSEAASHTEHLSGDKGRFVRAEVQDAFRDLARGANAPQRCLLRQLAHGFRAVHRIHIRIDHTGRDTIDPNARRPQFQRERSG